MDTNGAKHEVKVAEWAERVRECRSSGVSVKAWCAEQGIRPGTYYRWEREVLGKAGEDLAKRSAKHTEAEEQPTFAELPGEVSAAATERTPGKVVAEIVGDGRVIRIYEDADARVIRALCGAAPC